MPWAKASLELWKKKVLRDKTRSLLCLEILQKGCSECSSFLNKASLFLSRKPVYDLACPKLDMQNTSFTTEVLSIKSRDTMQNLKWIERKQFQQGIYWHILLCWLTLRFRATYVPRHRIGKTLHFWKSPLLSSHPALISGRDLENKTASKWGVACAWNAATFPPSLWHGSHYTEDVAFLHSLSSLFSLSFGQIRPTKSQFKCSTELCQTDALNLLV